MPNHSPAIGGKFKSSAQGSDLAPNLGIATKNKVPSEIKQALGFQKSRVDIQVNKEIERKLWMPLRKIAWISALKCSMHKLKIIWQTKNYLADKKFSSRKKIF